MNWLNRTLGDICDEVQGIIQTGPFGSQLHEYDYQEFGVPVVMPKDIIEGRISDRTIARVGVSHIERLARHKLEVGDIVYGRRGDIGRQALVTENEKGWLCGTGCLRISFSENSVLNAQFLHYYLRDKDVVEGIANQAIGSTLPNLNTSILRSVPISLPPLATQHKIAAVLSAYDELIENNQRRIAILEEMARNLYREWFVHFRFPGHEQAAFRETDLGRVPEGWEVHTLGQVLELAYGKALKSDNRQDGPIPVYGSSGVVGTHNESLVEGPGIIVGRKGNVGSVFWSSSDFYPIDTVFYVRTEVPLHYIYYNLKQQSFINSDAAVPGLSRHQAYSLPFVYPDKNLLKKFEGFISNAFEQTENLSKKNENLRRTRDLLLPRLVSGEIDVSELEIAGVEELAVG